MRTIGYARATTAQCGADQIEALRAAGCKPIFVDGPRGLMLAALEGLGVVRLGDDKKGARLRLALEDIEKGDVLVITRLDRLGASFPAHVARLIDVGARVRLLDHEGLEEIDGELWVEAVAAIGALPAPSKVGRPSGSEEET